MPSFRQWFEEKVGVDLKYTTPSQQSMSNDLIPDSTLDMNFIEWLNEHRVSYSNRKQLRLNRAHGTLFTHVHTNNTLKDTQFTT
jgi:hypothetical protein